MTTPVEQRLRNAYAQRAAMVPDALALPYALELHLAVPPLDPAHRTASRMVPLRLEPADFIRDPRRKQRGRMVGLAAVAAAVTLLAFLQTDRFQHSTEERLARAAAQPGYILSTVPAGLGRGTRIHVVDPQNLAPEPASFTMQYRQRNGSGRLSIQPEAVSIGGPWVSGPYVEVGGKRLAISGTGKYTIVSIPFGSRFARIDSSDIDRATLNAFASAVVADGPLFRVPSAKIPSGWEGRRAPSRSYNEYVVRSTQYNQDKNYIRINVFNSTRDDWAIKGGPAPKERNVTVGGVAYKVFGSDQFWSAVSESQHVSVSAGGPATSNVEAILGSLRRATSKEWAALDGPNAYAIGSYMVSGTLVDDGTIAGLRFRTVRKEIFSNNDPSVITGLVGVSGAIVEISDVYSVDVPVVWAPGVVIVKVPTSLQPRTATLTLTGKASVSAPFLPAVQGQKVQVAFFPGVASPTTGTYSVTSNDPKNLTVKRDVATGLTVK